MESMIQKLVDLINNFDPVSYLPEIDSVMGWVETFVRLCVMAAPVIMLVFGLSYLLLPPKEANHEAGYRFYFGMGSVEAWRFTQRLAGAVLGVLGLILTGVMLVIVMGFPNLGMMDMVWKAFWCLIWQGVLALLANAGIWGAAALRFDAKGNYRKKKDK